VRRSGRDHGLRGQAGAAATAADEELLADTGHLLMEERPDELAALVLGFLREGRRLGSHFSR